MLQNETVAVTMTSLRNNLSLSNENATCEIYTTAILLKIKLKHYVFHHITNISVNVIRLFASAISHLHSIATIQWQIYVRKYKNLILRIYIYIYMCVCVYIYVRICLFIVIGVTINGRKVQNVQ